MFKPRLRVPSPALVIAMVALALVLGGTAIAAGTTTYLTKASGTKLVKKLAPTLSVKNAKTVGGKQVKQFSVALPKNTLSSTVFTVDGVALKGSCSSIADPSLTIENDSSQGAMIGGYSSAAGDILRSNFTSSPVTLASGTNGGGVVTVQLRNGVVVSVQFAETGTLGGTVTSCYFSGSVIAS